MNNHYKAPSFGFILPFNFNKKNSKTQEKGKKEDTLQTVTYPLIFS